MIWTMKQMNACRLEVGNCGGGFDKKSLVKKLDNKNFVTQPPTPELSPSKQNQESAEDETLRRNLQTKRPARQAISSVGALR